MITRGEAPWFPGRRLVGSKVSITVQDNGRADRLGRLRGAFGRPVPDFRGAVAFIRTSSGNFTVRG